MGIGETFEVSYDDIVEKGSPPRKKESPASTDPGREGGGGGWAGGASIQPGRRTLGKALPTPAHRTRTHLHDHSAVSDRGTTGSVPRHLSLRQRAFAPAHLRRRQGLELRASAYRLRSHLSDRSLFLTPIGVDDHRPLPWAEPRPADPKRNPHALGRRSDFLDLAQTYKVTARNLIAWKHVRYYVRSIDHGRGIFDSERRSTQDFSHLFESLAGACGRRGTFCVSAGHIYLAGRRLLWVAVSCVVVRPPQSCLTIPQGVESGS